MSKTSEKELFIALSDWYRVRTGPTYLQGMEEAQSHSDRNLFKAIEKHEKTTNKLNKKVEYHPSP